MCGLDPQLVLFFTTLICIGKSGAGRYVTTVGISTVSSLVKTKENFLFSVSVLEAE